MGSDDGTGWVIVIVIGECLDDCSYIRFGVDGSKEEERL